MRLSLRRLSPLAVLAVAASTFALSCLTDPSGPSYQPGYLALAPSFESAASGVVHVASIHVVVVRDEDNTVVIDTVITEGAFSDSVDLSFSVLVSSSSETFTLTLECLSPTGDVVFSAGPLSVTATTSGTDNVVAEAVPLDYVGIGHNAADIDVPDADIYYIHMGDTLTVEAQALDSSGAAIVGTPIKWTSLDTTMLRFPDPAVGRMEAGQIRGQVFAKAELLTGPDDIFEVYVEPVPSEITIFSGDNQTGEPGTQLPVVLEVQVNAPDGPIAGSMVDFTTGDGGSFGQASMTTDANGYAWTTWTLGQSPGQQTATATVRAYPVLQTTFTASSVNPPATVSWTNIEGGFWSEPTNWSSGSVPGAADTVEITLDGQYSVWLDNDATVEMLTLAGAAGYPTLYITGNGTLTVNDAFVAGPQATVQVLGTITGAGSISNNSSLFRLEGGTISTSGGFNTAGTLALLGGTFDGTVVTNAAGGGIDWSGGDIALANGAMLSNLEGGVFGANARGSITGSIPVHNWGVFEKDGPDSTIIQAGLENYATVNVGAGWLVVGGELWHMDGALLSGIGTLDLANATIVTFEGDIGPGASPGILTVEGDLTLGTNSTVYVEINGTTAGTDYDHLNVVGNLGLAGTLDITMGFTPSLGNSFGVLDFLTTSGSFANITGLDIGSGMELDTIWSDNALTLEVVNATPSTGAAITWTGAGDGTLWSDASNWDLGRIPAALDTVNITQDVATLVELLADATVAHLNLGAVANVAIQTIDMYGGNTLQIDSAAVIAESGLLQADVSTLSGAGTITVRGTLDCQACKMVGPGSTNIEAGANLLFSVGELSTATVDNRLITSAGSLYWTASSIVMDNGAQIVNNGTIAISADDALTWGGAGAAPTIVNTILGLLLLITSQSNVSIGANFINDGSIVLYPATITFTGDFTHGDGAVIWGSDSSTVDLSGATVLGWDGNLNAGGAITSGILTFIGHVAPSALSTHIVDIGGLTPGTEHDQVTLSGDFTANGTLYISLSNGFTPQLGQTFTILTFASHTGEFSDTTGLGISAGLGFDLVWYDTSLELEVVDTSPASPADIVFFSDSGYGADLGVFTTTADGSAVTRVADTGFPANFVIFPRWSIDRQRISFSNDTSGPNALYIATSTGAELTQLVNNINSSGSAWSRDGQHLGFGCQVLGGPDNICAIANVDGPISGIPTNTYFTTTGSLPAPWTIGSGAGFWDPRPASQDRIIFAGDSTGLATVSRFFSVSYDGTGLNTIPPTPSLLQVGGGPPLEVLELDISSDGTLIVFVGYDTQTLEDRLYVMNIDGTGLRQLTFPTGTVYDERPTFSPDGTEVLFGRRDGLCELTYWIVDINNTDGSLERQIAGDSMSCEMDPFDQLGMDWSPDGSQIVLVGIDETYGAWRIYVVPSTVTPATYQTVRVRVGRDFDPASWIFEGQPNWRP